MANLSQNLVAGGQRIVELAATYEQATANHRWDEAARTLLALMVEGLQHFEYLEGIDPTGAADPISSLRAQVHRRWEERQAAQGSGSKGGSVAEEPTV